ncbi:MAG: ABC transporter permease [Eubacterium sp.]|nr:ABC transporter permease [Eubacterium sp.]
MNKGENIYNLKGFSKVFRFTLTQTFKNKGYRFSFIILVLMMMLMGPINYLSGNAGSNAARNVDSLSFEEASISKLYILNDSGVSLEKSDIEAVFLEKARVSEAGVPLEMVEGKKLEDIENELGTTDALIYISLAMDGYHVNGIICKSEESDITAADLESAVSIVSTAFEEAKLKAAGLKTEDVQKLMSGVSSGEILTEKKYIEKKDDPVTGGRFFAFFMGFNIIIMMVSSLSASYIVSSVTEEKQSKLVETLLVSIRPMALLVGKIAGMMSYVVLMLVAGLVGSRVSDFIMRNVLKLDMTNYVGSGMDFSLFTKNGVKGFVVLFLALIMSYLFFAFVAGLFGSAVSKTEDVQSATGSVMMFTMIGYFGSFFVGMSENQTLWMVESLVPPFSFFSAPILFIMGKIPLWTFLTGTAIQAVIIVALTMLAAKTYRVLILSDSSKPTLKAILDAGRGK